MGEHPAIKIRLYNELEHTLLTARHILAHRLSSERAIPILDLWGENVAVLHIWVETKTMTVLVHLTSAANDVGTTLTVEALSQTAIRKGNCCRQWDHGI